MYRHRKTKRREWIHIGLGIHSRRETSHDHSNNNNDHPYYYNNDHTNNYNDHTDNYTPPTTTTTPRTLQQQRTTTNNRTTTQRDTHTHHGQLQQHHGQLQQHHGQLQQHHGQLQQHHYNNRTTTTTPLATTTTPPTTTTTPPTTTTTTAPHTTKTTTSTLSKTSENQGNSSNQSIGSISVENPEQNLICKHNQMIFKFKPTFKHNVTIRKMSLRDQACRFRYDKTSGEYQTATAYTMCGTTMVEERRHILFKNLVRVTYVNNEIEANPLIERIEYYYIGLECRIRKNYLKTLKGQHNDSHIPGDGGIVVGPQTLHIDEYKEANASFRIDFQVYKSLAYDDSYGTEEFPIYLQVSHRIYFELSLDKKNLSVIPHNCYATKTPSYLADPKYYFIEKRCEKDETYRRHHHQQKQQVNQNKFRFSIEAFNFKDSDSIFVHCESYVCQDTSKENCQFGCPASNGRSKRDGIALGEIDEEIFMTSTLEIKIAEPTFHNYPTNNQNHDTNNRIKKPTRTQASYNNNNDTTESAGDKNTTLLYLQIPIVLLIIVLAFVLFKYVQRRRARNAETFDQVPLNQSM
uniref:ZP domain-containing protein n=1 Tax=Clytia hemisphaerica TaxID=252671 RepID=A0A7M5V3J7_9CNID